MNQRYFFVQLIEAFRASLTIREINLGLSFEYRIKNMKMPVLLHWMFPQKRPLPSASGITAVFVLYLSFIHSNYRLLPRFQRRNRPWRRVS